MMLLCLNSVFFIKCTDSFSAKVSTATKLKVNTYCCCFINNNDTFLVT